MKNTIFVLVAILISGCALFRSVRQADLDAWKGVSVDEVETHPIFSAMELDKRRLENGDLLYNFRNSETTRIPSQCKKVGQVIYGQYQETTQCSGGGTKESTCMNQFIVRKGIVQEYRPVGSCYTDCRARPVSRPCT